MAGCPPPLRISSDLFRVFPNVRTRRARKAHRCDCCGGPIDSGSVYLDTGELKEWPQTYRYCAECARATDAEREARFRAKRERKRAECESAG